MRAGLAEGSRGSAGTAWRNLGSKLVIVELATAVVLLAGAGLLGQSLYRLLHVDIGLRPDRLASVYVLAPGARYSQVRQCVALERRIVSDIANLPGVKSVAITSALPVRSNDQGTWIRVLGKPWLGDHNDVLDRDVSSDYLAAIGATLLRGRYFTDAEDSSKPRVVIVNQTMAKRYFPGEDPIGKQISFSSDPPVPMEIVGLVEDIKEGPLDISTFPAMYVPFNQNADNAFAVVVRTSLAGESLLSTLAHAIHAIDAGVVTEGGMMMTDRIGDSQSAYLHRSTAWLVGGFAALALLLSVVGLYGVIAYSVGQRTREIGVRMALGAEPGAVYRLILKEAGRLTASGIVLGLAGSLGVGALIRGVLFGVNSWDIPTLAAVAIVLGAAALLASYIPARRFGQSNRCPARRVAGRTDLLAGPSESRRHRLTGQEAGPTLRLTLTLRAGFQNLVGHIRSRAHLPHVVHTHDVSSREDARGDGRRSGKRRFLGRAMRQKLLARGADHHRQIQIRELAQFAENERILFPALAEAEARVDSDARFVDAHVARTADGRVQIAANRRNRVLQGAKFRPSFGAPSHVAHHQARVAIRNHAREVRLKRQTGRVVDNFNPKLQCALGHFRLVGVHGYGNREPVLEALQHGAKAMPLFVGGNARRARTGGFGADVDNIRALLFHFDGARKGAVGVGVTAAVGKRVGRHVEYAHHGGALAKQDFPLLEFPEKGFSH
jgi:hypothetical protein